MNTKQAKQLDFPNLLEKMGHHPVPGGVKNGGKQLWYRSPLKGGTDRTASFHLTKGNQVAWVFKCFSTGKEGTILDFVIAHEGYAPHDVASALAFLRDKFPGALFHHRQSRAGEKPTNEDLFSFHQPTAFQGGAREHQPLAADRHLEYIEDLPLTGGRLVAYLEESRKIPAPLAQKYLRLVRYRNLDTQKSFYAIGMANRAGGFEIRAASNAYSFKSALVARDISVFRPTAPSDSVIAYEGMLDFLSHLVMMNLDEPPCDAIVMHSVNSFRRAATFIQGAGYGRIFTLLDFDEPGQRCTKQFEAEFGQKASSFSHLLRPYKDVNECLQHGMKLPQFLNRPDTDWGFLPA